MGKIVDTATNVILFIVFMVIIPYLIIYGSYFLFFKYEI